MGSMLISIIVVVYLLIMMGVGVFASKRVKTSTDFALAGRKLGPFLLAGTLAATNIGGGTSLGIAEKAFGQWGLSSVWYVITAAIAFIVLAFIAPKLRSTMSVTISDFFEKRYGPANALVTALVMSLPMIGLTAVQIIASSVILSVMTGWSYVISVLIVTVVVTIYSVMGGLWGVAITDAIQSTLILVGTALAVPYAMHAAGGWSTIVSHIPEQQMSFTDGIGIKTIISLTLMYIASFAVGPEVIQRYYGGRDEKAVRNGSILGGLICIAYAILPAVLGLAAFAMVQQGIIDTALITSQGTRYILPVLAVQTMPPILVGVLFAALISATMSSADSDMLAAGTIISNDIYKKYIDKKADDNRLLLVNRIVMIICGLLSMGIALTNTKSIIGILMFSFSLRAGGAFIPYIVGHYSNKAGAIASMASLVSGSVAVLLFQTKISFFGMDPVVPGVLISAVVFFGITAIAGNKKTVNEIK
ncbi:sodium:solute symporter family protein [Oceanispirochaeta crateris]|uniref:Sodium:solute symporter family protein n=1 Tax=Oceanispirochaeta crateris TaxID=2518645 RepID=A0A5C1QLA5_9SPIO|nr:sodium:solute symporter family protein [Oceanispirochaeta crateris]QEN07316.1 sodium:solute symporter family protein [Oceanispirochaeta crateris]